jgi:hypothetical protein
MAKFVLLHATEDIYVFKLGQSVYYFDYRDRDIIKLYDAELNRLSVIMPDGWIYNSTGGEISLSVLKSMAHAYAQGYENGYKSKMGNYFRDFSVRLKKIITDKGLKSKFVDIFWLELTPYDRVRSTVGKLISNKSVLHKNPEISRGMLDRSLELAKDNQDELFITEIEEVIDSLPPTKFDPQGALFELFDVGEFELPLIVANIKRLESGEF